MQQTILILNAGSSSLKFALFGQSPTSLVERVRGQIEGIGSYPRFTAQADGIQLVEHHWQNHQGPQNHQTALEILLAWLEQQFRNIAVTAVGHRIVHGGIYYSSAVLIDDQVLMRLTELNPLAPLHQPHNLAGVRAAQTVFPEAQQIACFDTAFHRRHPWVNDTFALPREYYEQGIRRYGFHGLSYEYLLRQLEKIAPQHASGKVIAAHLGNGASMCAIHNGQSIGSTMGFTALDGLPMGTRCGQIDPGVLLYLIGSLGISVKDLTYLLYHQSGLKGLSGLSHDVRTLEASQEDAAQQALDYFVFRIRRELGAMAAILEGADVLVFAGGIGENAVNIRARICRGFEWLGIKLDEQRNQLNQTVVSTDDSRCQVFVIPTNEELMIAQHTLELLRIP